jgi:hypothetical protein
VFLNLDMNNQDKCLAGTDYHYSEVWFFFPSMSGGTGEIDSYAKFNVQENLWDIGPAGESPNQMARTAWTDNNQPGFPATIDIVGPNLVQQDTGYVDISGLAITGFAKSGYLDITDGTDFISVDQFIPDFKWEGTNPSLSLTLFFRDWPDEPETQMGPFIVTPTTRYITLRKPTVITTAGVTVTAYPAVRAREVAVEISTISGWWRFGAPRLRQSSAGRV